jgi:hypothetical protein
MARRQAFAASARPAMPRGGSVIVAKSSPDLAGVDRSPTESTQRMGASVANVWTAHTAAGKACRQRPSEEQHAPAAPTDEDGGSRQRRASRACKTGPRDSEMAHRALTVYVYIIIKVPGIAVVKQPCTHELRPELQRTTGPEPQPLQHRSGTSPAQLAPEPQVVHRPELSPELQLRTGRSGTSATPESVPELHLPQVGPELQVDASGTSGTI